MTELSAQDTGFAGETLRMNLVGCCLWGRTESDTTEVT